VPSTIAAEYPAITFFNVRTFGLLGEFADSPECNSALGCFSAYHERLSAAGYERLREALTFRHYCFGVCADKSGQAHFDSPLAVLTNHVSTLE
jgi:hypothetical protein